MEILKKEIFSKLKNIFSVFDLPLIESEPASGSDDYTTSFCFVPSAPIDLVSLMKAQCYFVIKVGNRLLNRLWYKTNIPHVALLCPNGKLEEFYKLIMHLESAQEFANMISNKETIEHLRDYTEAELTQLVQQFPERARAFIKDDYRETFLELSGEELGYDLEDYSEDNNVSPDTPIRNRIWKRFVDNCNWQIYLDELDYGQCEEWAKEVASSISEDEDIRYIDTYNKLFREAPELADRELQINLNRRFPNKSGAFMSKYKELAQERVEDASDRAERYADIFDGCISIGKDEIYAKTFAEGIMSDYYNESSEYWDIIATIHSNAKKDGLSDPEIRKKTNLFDSILGELEPMDYIRRIEPAYHAFTEIESGRDKKDVIRKILDSYLDSLTDDDFIDPPSYIGGGTKNSGKNFNRDMLQMMFPNDDVDSEDFEDGLDMEDFSRD